MVYLQHPAHHARAAEVVHREVRRALVFIFQEREPFAFPGFLVADQVDVGRLAKLGEDGQDVAFGEVEGEAAYVDVGGISARSLGIGSGKQGSRSGGRKRGEGEGFGQYL